MKSSWSPSPSCPERRSQAVVTPSWNLLTWKSLVYSPMTDSPSTQFAIFFGGPCRSVGSWKGEADPAFSVFQDPGIAQAPVNCAERIQHGQTGFPGGSDSKGSACNAGDLVWYLGWEDPLEEGMVTPSSILAWRIPMDRRRLVGSSPGGHKELDVTERLSTQHRQACCRLWVFASWIMSIFPVCCQSYFNISHHSTD